jgi:hypothetical protein
MLLSATQLEREETYMCKYREKILAIGVGFALYLLFGSRLEHYRVLVDSMVIAEFISRIFES